MLLALNAQTGSLLWSHSTVDDAFSPIGIENGLIVLALTPRPNTYGFCTYHSADGSQAWCTTSVPSLAGGVTAFSVMDGAIYASYPSNMQNPYTQVEALDLQNGHTLWSRQLTGSAGPGLLTTMNGVVYTSGKEGIYALNGSNGHTLWQANVGDVVAIVAGS